MPCVGAGEGGEPAPTVRSEVEAAAILRQPLGRCRSSGEAGNPEAQLRPLACLFQMLRKPNGGWQWVRCGPWEWPVCNPCASNLSPLQARRLRSQKGTAGPVGVTHPQRARDLHPAPSTPKLSNSLSLLCNQGIPTQVTFALVDQQPVGAPELNGVSNLHAFQVLRHLASGGKLGMSVLEVNLQDTPAALSRRLQASGVSSCPQRGASASSAALLRPTHGLLLCSPIHPAVKLYPSCSLSFTPPSQESASPRHPRGKQSTSRVYKANQLQGWMRSHFTNCLRGPSQRETLTPVSKVKALGGPLSHTPPGGHSVPSVSCCHKNLAHSWNYFLLCTLWDYCLGKEKGLDLTPTKRWGDRGGVAHPARGV